MASVENGLPQPKVRSIFFYNSQPTIGEMMGLHFFENRYRLLVQRALSDGRNREFVFLPNFADYQASHGDIGYVAQIVAHRPFPSQNPNELPRADVKLRFVERVVVLFHWIEPNSGTLSECVCVPIDPNIPAVEEALPMIEVDALEAALHDVARHDQSAQMFPASPHQHPNLPHHILHAASREAAESALAPLEANVPGIRGLIYPVVVPRYTDTMPITQLIKRLATLHLLRHPPPTAIKMTTSSDDSGGTSTSMSIRARNSQFETINLELGVDAAAAANAADVTTSVWPEDERVAAAVRSLSVKEIKAKLSEAQISIPAGMLEKDDLVDLVTHAAAATRVGGAASAAAEVVAQSLAGLRVPLICGCPSGGLVVNECRFDREGGALLYPESRSLHGANHEFRIDNQQGSSSVGQVCATIYELGAENLSQWPHPGETFSASDLRDDMDLYVPEYNSWDSATAIMHAPCLSLRSATDEFANLLLTPPFARVWKTDAKKLMTNLSRQLNWCRVRLLFIGHQEGGDEVAQAAQDKLMDVSDGEAAPLTLSAAGAVVARGGSLFSLLDREVLWLVAEWLVAMDAESMEE